MENMLKTLTINPSTPPQNLNDYVTKINSSTDPFGGPENRASSAEFSEDSPTNAHNELHKMHLVQTL